MFKYFLYSINAIFLITIGIRAILGNFFSNTFNIENLVTILLVSGLILALIWSKFYIKKNNITDSIERTQTVLVAVFLAILAFVGIGVSLNYVFSFEPNQTKEVKFLDIQPVIKTRGGIIKGEKIEPNEYLVFIENEGKKERIRYKSLPNYKQLIGQSFNLNIRKGLLGFDVFVPKSLSE